MAGSLILIDSVSASNSATVTLGGANWDDSFDVYLVTNQNVVPQTDTQGLLFRLLDTSNNPLTDASYHVAWNVYRANTTPENAYGSASFFYGVDNYIGTASGEVANGSHFIFNANVSSEYTFIAQETSYVNNSSTLRGMHGGGAYMNAVSTKGVQFYMNSGNIVSGEFKLYGIYSTI